MPKTLILIRHAKAVDRLEAEDDFERGLTERGRSDASLCGETLAAMVDRVDLALVSPSRRTLQTWTKIKPAFAEVPVEDPMALYHASTDMLMRAAKDALARADTVMMIGHNPGIGGFAQGLAVKAGARDHMPLGYPTATATVFETAEGQPVEALFETPRFVGIFNPKPQ